MTCNRGSRLFLLFFSVLSIHNRFDAPFHRGSFFSPRSQNSTILSVCPFLWETLDRPHNSGLYNRLLSENCKIFLDTSYLLLHRKDSEGMLTPGECPRSPTA